MLDLGGAARRRAGSPCRRRARGSPPAGPAPTRAASDRDDVIVADVRRSNRRRSPRGRSPGSSRVPISVLGMWVAIANTGAPLRLQSYRPFSRWRLPGPEEPSTADRAPRDLGVRARRERARLLVADMDELDVVRVPTDRIDDRVGRVAHDAVDLADPDLDHLVDQDLRHGLRHARSFSGRVHAIGRYSGHHIASWTASIGSATSRPGRSRPRRPQRRRRPRRSPTPRAAARCRAAGPCAGSAGSARPARARAAARNSGSAASSPRGSRSTPRPRPGNISALLAWPIRYVVAVELDRVEGTAGRDQSGAVGPRQQVGRRLFGQRRWDSTSAG